MANIDSKNYLLKNAVPSAKVPPGEDKGSIDYAYDEATVTVAATAADVIRTGIRLPKGYRVDEILVDVPAGGGTVDVGIAGATTKYKAAAAAGAQTIVRPLSVPTSDEDLIGTIGGTPASAGTYKFVAKFVKY